MKMGSSLKKLACMTDQSCCEFPVTFWKYSVNGSVVPTGLLAAHSASMSIRSLFTPKYASNMEIKLSTMSSTSLLWWGNDLYGYNMRFGFWYKHYNDADKKICDGVKSYECKPKWQRSRYRRGPSLMSFDQYVDISSKKSRCVKISRALISKLYYSKSSLVINTGWPLKHHLEARDHKKIL